MNDTSNSSVKGILLPWSLPPFPWRPVASEEDRGAIKQPLAAFDFHLIGVPVRKSEDSVIGEPAVELVEDDNGLIGVATPPGSPIFPVLLFRGYGLIRKLALSGTRLSNKDKNLWRGIAMLLHSQLIQAKELVVPSGRFEVISKHFHLTCTAV